MIIDPVSRVFGHMTHEKINALPVCPGAVQLGFKGVAAFMRGVVHASFHAVEPGYLCLFLKNASIILLDEATASLDVGE